MAAGRRAARTYCSPTWLARPPVATHQTHAVRATQGPTLLLATCDKTATPSARAGCSSYARRAEVHLCGLARAPPSGPSPAT